MKKTLPFRYQTVPLLYIISGWLRPCFTILLYSMHLLPTLVSCGSRGQIWDSTRILVANKGQLYYQQYESGILQICSKALNLPKCFETSRQYTQVQGIGLSWSLNDTLDKFSSSNGFDCVRVHAERSKRLNLADWNFDSALQRQLPTQCDLY